MAFREKKIINKNQTYNFEVKTFSLKSIGCVSINNIKLLSAAHIKITTLNRLLDYMSANCIVIIIFFFF